MKTKSVNNPRINLFLKTKLTDYYCRSCNKCWFLTPKTWSDRVHVCSDCGHREDRDINSAQVCLTGTWGQELSSLDVESPSSTDGGS